MTQFRSVNPTGKRRARLAALTALCCVAALSGACGGSDKPKAAAPKTTATALGVTEKEFAIALNKTTVPAGALRVTVSNAGTVAHEFVAFKTDLPLDQLPVNGSEVDESGAGITHVDPEAEDIAPGSSKTITLHLSAGRYVVLCNVPTHYGAGMRAELLVS
jgi:uncharacterized cupredoxin-like copper-binding protein